MPNETMSDIENITLVAAAITDRQFELEYKSTDIAALCILAVCIVLGNTNILTLLAFWKNRHIRELPFNYLVVSMAVSDLMFCEVGGILDFIQALNYHRGFGHTWCTMKQSVKVFSYYFTLSIVSVIALIRTWKVLRRYKPDNRVTKRGILLALCVCLGIALTRVMVVHVDKGNAVFLRCIGNPVFSSQSIQDKSDMVFIFLIFLTLMAYVVQFLSLKCGKYSRMIGVLPLISREHQRELHPCESPGKINRDSLQGQITPLPVVNIIKVQPASPSNQDCANYGLAITSDESPKAGPSTENRSAGGSTTMARSGRQGQSVTEKGVNMTARIGGMVTITFVMSSVVPFLPYVFGHRSSRESVITNQALMRTFPYIQAFANPFIYLITMPLYRASLRRALRRIRVRVGHGARVGQSGGRAGSQVTTPGQQNNTNRGNMSPLTVPKFNSHMVAVPKVNSQKLHVPKVNSHMVSVHQVNS